MKKILSVILIVQLFVVSVLGANASGININSDYDTKAAVLSGLSQINTNEIDNEQFVTEDYEINDISINNTTLAITGSISDQVFNVSGEIKKTDNENLFVIDASDSENNFEVIYNSIESGIQNTPLYFGNSFAGSDIIRLYLKNDQGQLVIIECFASSDVTSNLDESLLAEDDDLLKYWYAKVQQPELQINSVDTRASYASKYITYSYIYNTMGLDLEHYMELKHYIKGYDLDYSYASDYQVILKVTDEGINCSQDPSFNDTSSLMEIKNLKLNMSVDEGDAISSISVDGNPTKSGSINFDLDFNFNEISLSKYASLSVSYETPMEIDFNELYESFANDDTEGYVREAQVAINDKYRLDTDNQEIAIDLKLDKFNTTNKTNQKFKVKYSYFVDCLLSYTDSSSESYTQTFYYDSNY